MSASYQAVQWNRQKRLYDCALLAALGLFLALYIGLTKSRFPLITDEILIMRATGSAAFLLLHVILCIGPLCRLQPRLLPLLYNRRHLGVTFFLLALIHGIFVTLTYHAGNAENPILSIFNNSPFATAPGGIPFQPLGFVALLIFLLMAATSHDFWLANLSAPIWKALHMLVYLGYALILLHVAYGILQAELNPVYLVLVGSGLLLVLTLHLLAALKERAADCEKTSAPGSDGFLPACAVSDIPENRARTLCIGGERIALFKYGNKVSVVSSVCQHQNGPLGEGKIVDGCITCPWHGFQYLPETGASPLPFVEKIPTFRTQIRDGHVWLHPTPNVPGTHCPAALISPAAETAAPAQDEFFIGYYGAQPIGIARLTRFALLFLLLLTASLASVAALFQQTIGSSQFEYGQLKTFTGTLLSEPYPRLLVARPGTDSFSSYQLVAPLMHGFPAEVASRWNNRSVALTGTLVYRDDQTLIEALPESLSPTNAPALVPLAPRSLGTHTLEGEIVDSKCYLGVMNPAQSATHHACATRCIRGGIPPVLLVRETTGAARYYLLTSPEGTPVNEAVLPLIAEPVRITGELLQQGDTFILKADPATYQKIAP